MGDQARRVGRMTRGQLATVRFFFPFLRCMCAVLFFWLNNKINDGGYKYNSLIFFSLNNSLATRTTLVSLDSSGISLKIQSLVDLVRVFKKTNSNIIG
jgi:hypothetical protein